VSESAWQAIAGASEWQYATPGGSAANSLAALATLGARVLLVGRRGTDAPGDALQEALTKAGVPLRSVHGHALARTATCLVLVTPDAERTICGHPGVAQTMTVGDLPERLLARCRTVYAEAYLLDWTHGTEVLQYLAVMKQRCGFRLVLNLSDAECVGRNLSQLRTILPSLDCLIGNKYEFKALHPLPDGSEGPQCHRGRLPRSVITLGKRGAVVLDSNCRRRVRADKGVRVQNTTGAGDAFAAGILYGLTRGLSLQDGACIGALLASRALARASADMPGVIPRLLKQNVAARQCKVEE
jgi:sugar/nucleoside kinase (ribokinase family)